MFHRCRRLVLKNIVNRSLLPASEFPQKQVGVVSGIAYVVQRGDTTGVARIVDNQIAEAEKTLRNTGRDCNVLYFGKRNVSSGTRNQAGVDFDLRVCQRVPNHVPAKMVIGGNEKQRKSDWNRKINRRVYLREKDYQSNRKQGCDHVTNFNEDHCGANCKDNVFQVAISIYAHWNVGLNARDPGEFGILCRRTTIRAKPLAGGDI